MPEQEADTIFSRDAGISSYKVDDSLIFLDKNGGFCYALNSTGERVWDLLAEPSTLDRICDTLCSEFSIDRATCETDVAEILRELREVELVT